MSVLAVVSRAPPSLWLEDGLVSDLCRNARRSLTWLSVKEKGQAAAEEALAAGSDVLRPWPVSGLTGCAAVLSGRRRGKRKTGYGKTTLHGYG